jgi:non-heme chloroperoxidase
MEAGTLMIRRQFLRAGIALMISFILPLHSQSATLWKDPSPHAVRFVSVGDGVRLEALDWGGSGRAVVLLAGGGDTAHVFDNFAPKLTTHNHVYGITRRGFGASGYADAENVSERLGEDVLAVIEALKLDNAILVGHSIAGAELSWIANHYPNRVAGVVYIEAGYSYAFDDGKGASALDMMKLKAPQLHPQLQQTWSISRRCRGTKTVWTDSNFQKENFARRGKRIRTEPSGIFATHPEAPCS